MGLLNFLFGRGKERAGRANDEEYECDAIDDEEEYEFDKEDDINDIPVGCRACGGDYPRCKDSCPLFDD